MNGQTSDKTSNPSSYFPSWLKSNGIPELLSDLFTFIISFDYSQKYSHRIKQVKLQAHLSQAKLAGTLFNSQLLYVICLSLSYFYKLIKRNLKPKFLNNKKCSKIKYQPNRYPNDERSPLMPPSHSPPSPPKTCNCRNCPPHLCHKYDLIFLDIFQADILLRPSSDLTEAP